MLESMTGFAEVFNTENDFSVRISIKSVNGKSLHIHTALNRQCLPIEEGAYAAIKSNFHRGTISALITITKKDFLPLKHIDDILTKVKELPERLLPVSVEIGSILRAARTGSDIDDTPPAVRKIILAQIHQCVMELKESRKAEGEKLTQEVLPIAKGIKKEISRIKEALPELEKEVITNLTSTINSFLKENDVMVDESDLAREIAVRCEKTDVKEEVERSLIHIDSLIETVEKNNGPVGKKLDFICQELYREVSTLGVKIKNTGYSSMIIDLKTDIERIREQVQNVQ